MDIGIIIMGRDALRGAERDTKSQFGRSATPRELAKALAETIRSPIFWDEESRSFKTTEEISKDDGLELLLDYATLFVKARQSSPAERLASSLTYSEKQIALAVLNGAAGRSEYRLKGAVVARKAKMACSFVTSCILKMKISGILETHSLGRNGTLVRILDTDAANRARTILSREVKDELSGCDDE